MRPRRAPSDEELYPDLSRHGMIAIDCETYDPLLLDHGPGWHRDDTFIAGVAVGTEAGFRQYYGWEHEGGGNIDMDKCRRWLKAQLKRPDQIKVGAHLLYDIGFLGEYGIEVKGPLYDVQNAEPLLDENAFNYKLERLSKKYLGVGKIDDELDDYLTTHFGVKGKKVKGAIWRAPAGVVAPYGIGDVNHPLEIFKKQKPLLEAEGLWDLFLLESKLIPLLYKMRKRGVRVDVAKAEEMRDRMQAEYDTCMAKMRHITGRDVSVWAADSLAPAFDDLGIRYPLTPKTQKPSLTKPFLERLAEQVPFAKLVLEGRRLDKMKGTFLEGCILNQHQRGRIHCQFHQQKTDDGGTVTGRFSCVAEWTPVLTKRGEIPIRDVQIGDEVWTHKRRWRKVLATWIKGEEQMLEVRLSNGEVMTCTRKHRLLTVDGEWVTVGELYERLKEMDLKSSQCQESPPIVPPQGHDNEEGSQATRHNLAQRLGSAQGAHAQGGVQGNQILAPFSLQNGGTERHAREIWQEAPQLEGSLHRKEWLHHIQTPGRATPPDAQSHRLQNIRHQETAPGMGGPSYRRRPFQLRQAQFGGRDQEGAQDDPLVPTDGAGVVEIEAIAIGRPHQVYDITVEEDESYASLGCFSHNSSDPNLQFIPERTEEGKLIRSIFIPEEGCDWAKPDYSQIEFRLMVHDAADNRLPGAAEIVRQYHTDPDTDFHEVVAEIVYGADFTDTERKRGKTINFGIAFGEGKDKLASQLGVPVQEAMAIIANYHRKVPFMERLADGASRIASTYGEVITLLGRKRRFPWGKTKWNDDGSQDITIFPHRVPGARRMFTHKALNARIQGTAADIMKKAMVALDEWGWGSLGVPHLTVHDELDFSMPRGEQGLRDMRHVKEIMETVVDLHVPLKCDIASGPNWGDCKDWTEEDYRRAA